MRTRLGLPIALVAVALAVVALVDVGRPGPVPATVLGVEDSGTASNKAVVQYVEDGESKKVTVDLPAEIEEGDLILLTMGPFPSHYAGHFSAWVYGAAAAAGLLLGWIGLSMRQPSETPPRQVAPTAIS